MSERVLWQGSLDMLCGIYCAARLIACFKVQNSAPANQSKFFEVAAESAFYALMRSVEAGGFLTAKRLCESRPGKGGGFKDKELERIFNRLEEPEREGLTAIAFCRAKIARLKGSQRRALLSQGACAIVNEAGGNHWITVEGKHRDGGYKTFDPSLEDSVECIPQINWSKGLFIGPAEGFKV